MTPGWREAPCVTCGEPTLVMDATRLLDAACGKCAIAEVDADPAKVYSKLRLLRAHSRRDFALDMAWYEARWGAAYCPDSRDGVPDEVSAIQQNAIRQLEDPE